MTEQPLEEQITHKWYSRPVFFVADVERALQFYVDLLGFEKAWHSDDGNGNVCQVNRAELRDNHLRVRRPHGQRAPVRISDPGWHCTASPGDHRALDSQQEIVVGL